MRWGVRKKRRPTLAQGPRAADEAWAKAFCGTTNASQRANELLIAATTLDPVPVRFFGPHILALGSFLSFWLIPGMRMACCVHTSQRRLRLRVISQTGAGGRRFAT